MNPLDKLRAEIDNWEQAESNAIETLRYTRVVLPRLRESLDELVGGDDRKTGVGEETRARAIPETRPEDVLLRGNCRRQIKEALLVSGEEMTPKQLEEFLAKYGRRRSTDKPFGRGAINTNLRHLFADGEVDRVKAKRGLKASWAYKLREEDTTEDRGENREEEEEGDNNVVSLSARG